MQNHSTKSRQIFEVIGAIITWFAVGLQFYLIIQNRVAPIPETIIRFFSFYTILTNILVALYFTFVLIKPNSPIGIFLSQARVVTAITLYITIVGIIYNVILRGIWQPTGLQQLADELLHVVVPVLFIVYWIIFATKAGLQWKNIFHWLIYPLVYVIFILFRGALSGFYPYPFIDVTKLGYNKVLLHSAALFCMFLLVSLFIIAIAKSISRASHKN